MGAGAGKGATSMGSVPGADLNPLRPGFALIVLGSVYVHEMGHTFAFRRYGIAVTPPMFVPGFGAFVRGSHYPKSLTAIGDVALSGPLWGGIAGGAIGWAVVWWRRRRSAP